MEGVQDATDLEIVQGRIVGIRPYGSGRNGGPWSFLWDVVIPKTEPNGAASGDGSTPSKLTRSSWLRQMVGFSGLEENL
jgi:hypothetical protein